MMQKLNNILTGILTLTFYKTARLDVETTVSFKNVSPDNKRSSLQL
jgi:hypothetical protein